MSKNEELIDLGCAVDELEFEVRHLKQELKVYSDLLIEVTDVMNVLYEKLNYKIVEVPAHKKVVRTK